MSPRNSYKPIQMLLVEDSPGDVRLTLEALKLGKVNSELHVVENGIDALAYLRQEGVYSNTQRPDLILLDLNLPRMDGRELLAVIKSDSQLRRIPVIVLTASTAVEDITRVYDLHANCYINKPADLAQFMQIVEAIEDFWLTVVRLPED